MLNQKNKTSNERNRKTVKQSHGAPEKKPAAPPTSLANKQNQEQRQKTILLNQNHFRMKAIKLFTFALAALALGACSKDDDLNGSGTEGEEQKGEIIEGIKVGFSSLVDDAKSRAINGEQASEGTEALIYEAFVFAKEAMPKHDRALTGDWTVIRVTADASGKLVAETGGVDTEKTAKIDLVEAINKNATTDNDWLAKDVATFAGVRQGDYVYVIANDPTLTLAVAAANCHVGTESETWIKEYTSNINKDYLGKLTYSPENKVAGTDSNELPNGRFVMAGKKAIPVSPTVPSGGKIELTVGLDRELAKVMFSADITNTPTNEAFGNVAFQEGDGIVVARIAPKTSMFTDRTGTDWFVPANTNIENWPINNHALVNNAYSSFCDATPEGSMVFDGVLGTTDWQTGMNVPADFNTTNPVGVSEYRYSWKMSKDNFEGKAKTNVYMNSKTMMAPAFYTTPNYSNNPNSVTVICTQATYVGRGVIENAAMTNKYIDAALTATEKNLPTGLTGITIPNVLMQKATDATTLADEDITAKVVAIVNNWGIKPSFTDDAAITTALDKISAADKATLTGLKLAELNTMMDRFYIAVLLQQRLDNKEAKAVVGSMATVDLAGANYGNGIPAGTNAFYANAASDSLLLGWTELPIGTKKAHYAIAFYIGESELQADVTKKVAALLFASATPTITNTANGFDVRAKYFTDSANFKAIKGHKVYYRADVADYVGGVSNKLTERNTYYKTVGTITSLGAKTIHDAIYAAQNSMSVSVTVNKWVLSINRTDM